MKIQVLASVVLHRKETSLFEAVTTFRARRLFMTAYFTHEYQTDAHGNGDMFPSDADDTSVYGRQYPDEMTALQGHTRIVRNYLASGKWEIVTQAGRFISP